MFAVRSLDRFLHAVHGQPLREGTRYASEARVGDFAGSPDGVSTVVRGRSEDYNVALWVEQHNLLYCCDCPSWREPCKHTVAAVLVFRQWLTADRAPSPTGRRLTGASRTDPAALPAPDTFRRRAVEERRSAARRERLEVRLEPPPFLRVESPSGFSYRIHMRGGPEGPHSCACPDFEANRLHTCKHVERVRIYLRSPRAETLLTHHRTAVLPRVYLHFGEVVEPRLLGTPSGPGAAAVRARFDDGGAPVHPLAMVATEARELTALGGDVGLARCMGLRDWLADLRPWVEPDALAWLETRLSRRPLLPDLPFPRLVPEIGLRPYPYQWTGAEFLARAGRGLLADEMGLGKTAQAILAAVALRRAAAPVRSVTIVCPASLRAGWQHEIRRWIGEDATLLEGSAPRRARTIASSPTWLITHYEQTWRDHRHHQAHPPDLLIVDEAQRAKGLRTRTARVLKAIVARHVFALTGTPLENRLEEAYAITQLIDQRLLPPLWQLDRDHFVRDDDGRRVIFYRGLDALRSRLAPAFLRRCKKDVALELPGRARTTVLLPMHPEAAGTYDEVMARAARILRKDVLLPADLDRVQRYLTIARRSCNGPHMLGLQTDEREIPKLRRLERALDVLCRVEGRKVVVFSEWTTMTTSVERLCRRLRLPVYHLSGRVPVRRRPRLLQEFSNTDRPAVFVSTDAGGVGLNLQTADAVVNLDLPWNPARLEQRVARVHRIGSRGPVDELLMVTEGSVEERILHLHGTKRNVLANIWDRGTEEVIAAPGGSGALRDMMVALLDTRCAEPVATYASSVPGG